MRPALRQSSPQSVKKNAARTSRPSASSCDLASERERTEALYAEEAAHYGAGYRVIAGVDEAGRGCLAGPVYAAAVVLFPTERILGLNDSKLLSPETRDGLAMRIRKLARGHAIGVATAAEIDLLGIVVATSRAMIRALAELCARSLTPDLVLIDGVQVSGIEWEQKNFIKGDQRVAAIAAASILAKTARDSEMETWHSRFPYYGFDSHRGYGTEAHLTALSYHGPSSIHRFSFDRVLPARKRRELALVQR